MWWTYGAVSRRGGVCWAGWWRPTFRGRRGRCGAAECADGGFSPPPPPYPVPSLPWGLPSPDPRFGPERPSSANANAGRAGYRTPDGLDSLAPAEKLSQAGAEPPPRSTATPAPATDW
ncbi:hypothetical protein GCM10023083_45780 [Streptomyces phyllanthi]